MITAPRHHSVPPTGPHRPDAVGLFAAMAAILALAAAAVGSCVCITGCASGAPSRKSDASPHVLVVGERVRVVHAGETIVVPPCMPPARTWYLVDDEGLWQWLGIQAPNRTFVTNDDQRVTLRRRQ